jgi:amino-acid N-acetyltransferase
MCVIRQARTDDVVGIQKLINSCASSGVMLPRSRMQLYVSLRDFVVAEDGGQIVGCCAMTICWEDLAEIRSLAVAASHRRRGLGRGLFGEVIREARQLGIHRLFALTTTPEFFAKFGFQVIDKKDLPHKIWNECINCPKFPDDCDETAVIRVLDGEGGDIAPAC